MGLGIVGDALGRAVGGKLGEHEADAFIVRAGVQLAVGKGPGAALAELHVVLGVQLAAAAQALDGQRTRVHILSALEHDRPHSGARQQQRGEHPRGAKAHHDGPRAVRRGRGDRVFLLDIGGDTFVPDTAQRALLAAAQLHGHSADIVDIVLFARVQRAPHELPALDAPRVDAQLRRRLFFQRLRRLLRQQAQIPHEYHRPSLPAIRPLAQAHCRLKPPQSPSMSSSSPQTKSRGINQLSSVSALKPAVRMPPAVTWA